MRWILTIILGIFILLPLQSGATEVRIGIDSNPPLTFVDGQGTPRGLFPDLLQHIAESQDWSIKYVPCQWSQCLDALSAGDIDILPAIAYTEERAAKFHFAEEVVVSSWGQIYHRRDTEFSSVLELAGKKLAVLKKDIYFLGEQGLLQVADNFDIKINYVEVSSYQEAFSQLRDGMVDAAMVGRFYGIKHRQEYNLLPSPIMIRPIQVRPAFSAATSKQLTAEFDQLLHNWKLSADSIYYQLLDKWLGENAPATLPGWFKITIYLLAAVLVLLLITNLWTRQQVKIKTLQLAEKNQHLQLELEERHKIEQELLERQQQYRVFFEESHSAMLLIDPETAAIVNANPAACQFYKYSHEQLTKMKMWQINQLGEAETHKRLALIKGQGQQQFEFIHTLADGEKVPVEVHRSPIQVREKTLLYAIVHNISKRKKAEKALEERNQFLQSVIDGVSDPIMVIGLDFHILQMNQAARGQLGGSSGNLKDITCHQLSHAFLAPCNGSEHVCPILEVNATGQPVTVILHHVTDQGKRIFELCASPLFDENGSIYAVIEVARDITERLHIEGLLSENEKRLHHMAHHDSLTNLPNRLLFDDRLKQALSKARRSHRQIALFFLDLDHLKLVNDNLGHDYGDLLLIDVAKRLRKCVREGDTVARLGGDEFLILLEEIESIEMIEIMAERICAALSHELTKGDFSQKISASIGISIYPEDARTGQEMMKNADLAMYRVKHSGKASYQFYSAPQGRFLFG